MNASRSVSGWWVICLMAGFGAQPLFAAEPGEISRAVEVAPPKGWTPEMPLFHDESTTFSREAERVVPREEGAAHAPRPTRPAHALGAAVSEAPSVVRRARKSGQGGRLALARREPVAKSSSSPLSRERARQARSSASASLKEARVAKAKGSKAATSRTRSAAAKRGTASKAHQTGVRQGVRSASPAKRASAVRQPAGGVARSAKARRAQAAAPGPRQRAVPRTGVSAPGPAATTSPSLR